MNNHITKKRLINGGIDKRILSIIEESEIHFFYTSKDKYQQVAIYFHEYQDWMGILIFTKEALYESIKVFETNYSIDKIGCLNIGGQDYIIQANEKTITLATEIEKDCTEWLIETFKKYSVEYINDHFNPQCYKLEQIIEQQTYELTKEQRAWILIYGNSFPTTCNERESQKSKGRKLLDSNDIEQKVYGALLIIKSHFARSATAGNNTPKNHVDLMRYIQAYIHNESVRKDSSFSNDVISELIKRFGSLQSNNLPIGQSYWITS